MINKYKRVVRLVYNIQKTMDNSGDSIIQELRQRAEVLDSMFQEDAQRKSEQIRSSMFQNSDNVENFHKPVNIFANSKKPQTKTLFGEPKKSVNLFQIGNANILQPSQQGAKNIFNAFQKPAVQDKEDEQSISEGSNAGDSGIKSQNVFKTDPDTKKMNYQYNNQLTKVADFSVRKFKNGVAPAKDEVYITLEKVEGKSGVLYLMVRNCTTKISVFQGIMMKNISNPEHFMGKQDNIRFEIIKKNRSSNKNTQGGESERKTQKLVKEIVKLQFINEEEATKFLKVTKDHF